MEMNRRHNIAFLGFDRIQLLDLAGPLEAFATANDVVGGRKYHCFIVSENPTFTSESRIRLLSDYQIKDTPKIDTLIIPGGVGAREPAITSQVRSWIDQNFDDIHRLEQSKIYLSKRETSIEVAAYKVGYSSSDAFRRSFKRKYGISPHSYQLRFQ